VASIRDIGGTISRIAEISQAIAAALKSRALRRQEISRSVQQAAQGASQVAGRQHHRR
jgi:methyl-accepting chemotaxis protein